MGIATGPWYINDLLTFTTNTHNVATGAGADADSAPTFRVYEDETTTAILTGSMAKLDDTNTIGFYSEQLTLSAANGFEVGKSYSIYVGATVNSVAATQSFNFKVIATPVSPANSDIAAIKAKTDNLPSDPADQSLIIAATDSLAVLIGDVPTNAELATALAGADDATLAAIAAISIPTTAQIADAVHDEVVDGTATFRESVRLQNSALLGKASGMDTTTAVFRDLADSRNRISATVDANGNRTAVTLDPS